MTSAWHWFVIIGTIGSLIGVTWLLIANRRAAGQNHESHEWDGIRELDTPLPMWWVGMFAGSVLFAVIYLVIFPGLGNYKGATEWTSAARVATDSEAHRARYAPLYSELAALTDAELLADRRAGQIGRRLFINNCATCHGVGAQGSFGFPNLTDTEWIWGSGIAAVEHAILNGRLAAMPPWVAALGEEGIQNTAHYVRALSGQEHDQASAAAGEKHFQTLCVACHGSAGKGNPLLGAPDLTNNIWLYGGDHDQIAFTLRNGRNGRMPSQAAHLSPEKARILAGYVTGLARQ